MDKFQSELLAQLKEHNRLMKELVKLQRAAINEPKKVNTEIFSAVKVRPAHWSEPAGYPGMYKCTKCGEMELTASKFCPNCGAKMYSEGKETEKEGEEDA